MFLQILDEEGVPMLKEGDPTSVTSVGLGGKPSLVGHGGAEEYWRGVYHNLECIGIVIVKIVDLRRS